MCYACTHSPVPLNCAGDCCAAAPLPAPPNYCSKTKGPASPALRSLQLGGGPSSETPLPFPVIPPPKSLARKTQGGFAPLLCFAQFTPAALRAATNHRKGRRRSRTASIVRGRPSPPLAAAARHARAKARRAVARAFCGAGVRGGEGQSHTK